MAPNDAPPAVAPKGERTMLEKLHDGLTSPGGRLIRYILVLVIVGAAVYFSLAGWFQVCEVVESEKEGLTRTCSGPDLTSAGVLAAVIFVLLLLWPDLSEFSAFGVTLKKLVQKVDEKITDTRDKATHIDGTTTETKSRLESLSSTIDSQGGDVRARLSLIQSNLTRMSESGWGRETAPPRTSASPLTPAPRWDQFDRSNFLNACRGLSGPDELDAAISELHDMIGEPWWPDALEFGVSGDTASFEGLILGLLRRFRARWDTRAVEDPHRAAEIDAILRAIERMLLALISGKKVDDDSIHTAAGVLVLLHRVA
ncbi:hypothetical protein J7E45_08775 [Microbacterium sp. ISL-59]|uniref:hypothetical protein n=1 Tax=Microbacterium sp. ISL-59 TaxID=2819159 RepID=UPI001BEBE7E5|nr:hypothetical protein [Microbacterium sp. ISL-59]MBT2495700.1 hypothetical protein [Microbacterium sp. ISL-59]